MRFQIFENAWEVKKSKCENHFKWVPIILVCKMMRGFQIWPHNSNGIIFDPPWSFSMLRRFKSWLRSTMTQHRLNSVAICAAYPDELRSLNVARIVDGFIRSKPVRSKWFAAAEEV